MKTRVPRQWLELSDPPAVLAAAGMFRVRVAGWSMYPALLKGDELTVEAVSPAAVRHGDLLVFRHALRHGAALVCHRLVAVEDTGGERRLVTRGDATTGPGERIEPDQVVGRVVDIRRDGWRGWPLAARVARRLDRGRTWVRERLAACLERIQRSGVYRRVMRIALGRRIVVSVGLPAGHQRVGYRPIADARRHMAGQPEFRLAARLGGAMVATLHAVHTRDACEIRHLHVRRRYRRLALGRRLLELAVALAFEGGAMAVRVTIGPDEEAARCLLHRAGFRETRPGRHAIYKEGAHVPDLRAEIRRT